MNFRTYLLHVIYVTLQLYILMIIRNWEMNCINEKLKELYLGKIPAFREMVKNIENDKGLIYGKQNDYVGPLLMHCWEDAYLKEGNKRILFVGQETNGWETHSVDSDSFLEDSVKTYFEFAFGTYQGKKRMHGGPFWQTIRKINREVNATDRYGLNFLWTNVNKFGINGSGRPDPMILNQENEHFNILLDEIKITKPDFVIFLCGPNYKKDLIAKIPDVSFSEVLDKYSPKQFAEVKSQLTPSETKMYRIYHPTHIYKSKVEEGIKNTINDLIVLLK